MSLKEKISLMPRKLLLAGGGLLVAGLIFAVLMLSGVLGSGGGAEKMEEARTALRALESGLIEISGQLMPSEDAADDKTIRYAVERLAHLEESVSALLAFLPEIDRLAESGRLEMLNPELGDVQSQMAEARKMLETAVAPELMEAAFMSRARNWITPLQGDVRSMTSVFYETKREMMGQLGEFVYLTNSYSQNRNHEDCRKFLLQLDKFGGTLDSLEEQQALDLLRVKKTYQGMRRLKDEYMRPEAYVARVQPVLESVSEQVFGLREKLER